MLSARTFGCYPTYREVRAYYAREDFLNFLRQTMKVRKVILLIPERKHWEPQWERDRVVGESVEDVRQYIIDRIESAYPDASPDERLPFYPSFHQSLGWWENGNFDGQPSGEDGVLESDMPSWRESFHEVLTLVEALREAGVPHVHKYSGHRSLHVKVPFSDKRIKAGLFGGSNAHRTELLRMPFSLNEDTGMVSLPLSWEDVNAFRPWQASMHAIERCECSAWLQVPGREEREQINAFIKGLKDKETIARRSFFDIADSLSACRAKASALAARTESLQIAEGPQATAWRALTGNGPMAAEQLASLLDTKDVEAKWLATEAYLLHGGSLPTKALARLSTQDNPFVGAAGVDLLSRFGEESSRYFVEQMRLEEMEIPIQSLALLAQAERLRDEVMAAIRAIEGRAATLVLRVACVTGVHMRDWNSAWEMIRAVEADHAGNPHWEKGVEALRRMQDLGKGWGHAELVKKGCHLAELGPDILDLLLLGHTTQHTRPRRGLLVALADIGDERALDVLVRGLEENRMKQWALRGLLKIGAAAVPTLIDAASNDQARTRRYAIRCLNYLGDPRAHVSLVTALKDSDWQVRHEAAKSLKHPAPPELDALCEAALAETGEIAAKGRHSVGWQVVLSLASHGEEGLRRINELAYEKGNVPAAMYLVKQDETQARKVLHEALKGSAERQLEAVSYVADLGPDPEAADAVIACLPKVEKWRRQALLEALVQIGNSSGLATVLEFARSDERLDRKGAALALRLSEEPRAHEALMAMMEDKDKKVRMAVLEAMLWLGEKMRDRLQKVTGSREASNEIRTRALSALSCIDLKTRIERGDTLDRELVRGISGSTKPIWNLALKNVKENVSQDSIEHLLKLMFDDSGAVHWAARRLLIAAGEQVRATIEEAARTTANEEHRKIAFMVLEHIGTGEDEE